MVRHNSGQQQPLSAEIDAQAEPSAHHISSIAHLFFDDGVDSEVGLKDQGNRQFMIFSAGSSPVAAVASAGLSMGSNGDFFSGKVVLRENDGMTWSSRSFLPKSSFQLLGPAGTGENEGQGGDYGFAWAIQTTLGAAATLQESTRPRETVRWFHAGCADDNTLQEMETISTSKKWGGGISGAADGLVWCLLEKEAVSLVAAYQLGRLISLLQPSQVEILIFPDSWSKTGKPIWQRKLFQARDKSSSHQNSLVHRCRELAAAVGDCNVSLMPESLAQGHVQPGSSGNILQMIASRMLGAV